MRLLLSSISTRHSTLKKHWSATGQVAQCPLTVLGSIEKPKEDTGGLLCLIDDFGFSQKTVNLKMAAGMVNGENGVLITTFSSIHEADTNLGTLKRDVVSSPLFNALHSISRTERGYLVASTGLDLLLEFDRTGNILWSWWAIDHGFEFTPTGSRRELDKFIDYRSVQFGTLAQTTHINSAAELPDGRVLASLFHQGMVIAIDRDSGDWQPVLEGLDHPHSIRIINEEYFTVADTARGRGLLVHIDRSKGKIENAVTVDTNWLQDCVYDACNDCWVMVDGKHSQVSIHAGLS